MRLNPGLHVTYVRGGQLQIGSGRNHQVFPYCDSRLENFVELLRAGVPDGDEVAAAAQCELTPSEIDDLIAALQPCMIPFDPSTGSVPGYTADLLRDDMAVRWADRPTASPDTLLERRRTATVQVAGLGRIGSMAAQELVDAGVGQLVVWDPRPVTVADLGPVYRPADLGRPRAAALARSLEPQDQRYRVWPAVDGDPLRLQADMTLQVTRGAADLKTVADARAADHPLLPVIARDDDIIIGPWVDPNRPGCPQCWQLWTTGPDDHDALRAWALMDEGAGWEDRTRSAAAGTLAALQILARIDTNADPDANSTIPTTHAVRATRLSGSGEVEPFVVRPHPECGCQFAFAAML